MIDFSRLMLIPRLWRRLLLIVPILGVLILLSLGVQKETSAGPSERFQAPPSEFQCRWTETPVSLDGKADEAAWKRAEVIDTFYLPWLGEKARPARTATKA